MVSVLSFPNFLRAPFNWEQGRFAVVLEKVTDSHNQSAVLRSAEALGIQHIFIVDPPLPRNEEGKPVAFAKKVMQPAVPERTLRGDTFKTLPNHLNLSPFPRPLGVLPNLTNAFATPGGLRPDHEELRAVAHCEEFSHHGGMRDSPSGGGVGHLGHGFGARGAQPR